MPGKSSWIISLVDRVSRPATKIANKIKLITRSMKFMGRMAIKAGKKLVGMTKRFATSMKGLAVGLVSMLGIGKVVKTGADFEQSIAGIEAITGITGKKLEKFKEISLTMSTQFGNSASEIADGIKMIASEKSELIDDPKGLEEVTRQSLILSKAAGITMPEAVKTMVGALNQWGVGADQAAKFTEVLAVGQKIGASNIQQLGQSMKNAGVVAAKMGLSFGATVATLEVLGSAGLKGAEAGTAMRSAMLKMDQAMGDAGPTAVGWNQALINLRDSGISGKDMMKLFGLESVTAGNILLSGVGKIAKWTDEINNTKDALRQARVQMNTFHGKSDRLARLLDTKLIGTFDELSKSGIMSETFDKLANAINSLDTEKIASWVEGLVITFNALSIAVGIIVDMFKVLASLPLGLIRGAAMLTGAVVTRDASGLSMESLEDAFSIGGDLFGGASNISGMLGLDKDKVEIELTIKGNTAAVEKVETKSRTLPTKTSLVGA